MPIISKYSNEEINNLVEQLLDVVANNKVSVDLALIALGNTVSNIIDDNVKPEVKQQIAKSFADALLNSVENAKH
ncbi:DUF1414 domain-containing protein [Psychrosphaera ytuae]|uniref:DUF1414 domain-containing protein n=1 Tax=Psychrosphaera ytuae TaxID=2820710 RepID=A0A975DBA1_9GAMM|nr:DUF1414 domain-containing protein [Psychrosphaera ytuae]QTH63977.1 DUF1414 domain-containing protein [Psychrosphaera ytuae]